MDIEPSEITLEQFRDSGQLSVRSYNACIYSGIENIVDLKVYYEEYRSFKHLRNCGLKSQTELFAVLNEYLNHNPNLAKTKTDSSFRDTSIEELNASEKLSSYGYTLCKNVRLLMVSQILSYYNKYHTFKNIDGFGLGVNKELINICKEYSQFYEQIKEADNTEYKKSNFEIERDILQSKIKNLSVTHNYFINSLITAKAKSLSARAFNVLEIHLGGDFSVNSIFQKILFTENFNFKNLRNTGINTSTELERFTSDFRDLLDIFLNTKSFLATLEEIYRLFLVQEYKIEKIHYDEVVWIFRDLELVPVFRSIKVLIDNGYLLKNKSDIAIFKAYFETGISSNKQSYQSIAKEVGLTRERIRQKCQKLLHDYSNKFLLLKYFELQHLYLYNIDTNQPCIWFDDNLLETINQVENVNFNKNFVSFVFSQILRNTHELIGLPLNENLKINKRSLPGFKELYLINKELTNVFDFNSFVYDIDKRINERIDDTYQLNFQPYLLVFFKHMKNTILDKRHNLDLISEICEQILFNEFSINLNSDNSLVFEQNTHKNLGKYLLDLLSKVGHPINIEEIFNLLNEEYPGLFKNPNAVRSLCQRSSKGKLIFFGRTSTYGLKEWEKTNTNIKGGTIRDIAEEYLSQFDVPCQIADIIEYVMQFRPASNHKSILYNLRLENKNRFLFFKNRLIGLKTKIYKDNNLELLSNDENKRLSWQDQMQMLLEFVSDNHRLPSVRKGPVESSMYNFYTRLRQAQRKNKLSSDQLLKLNELEQYIDISLSNV